MLGNKKCEEVCNNEECAFDLGDCLLCQCDSSLLGDGHCDEECLNQNCDNDHMDCESLACIPGCYPYMINNSVCDSVCNTADCDYDGEDCFCSAGCSPNLINNLVCDSACNNKDCSYDGTDCQCAPGCPLEVYGTDNWNCYVPNCNYDNRFGTSARQILAFAYQLTTGYMDVAFDDKLSCSYLGTCDVQMALDALTDRVCYSSCDMCMNSSGFCYNGPLPNHCLRGRSEYDGECYICDNINLSMYCVDSCPRNLPIHPISPHICYPAKDNSSSSNPGIVYVTNSDVGGNVGNWTDPFYQLSKAFAQNFEAYAIIYLLKGWHKLSTLDSSSFDGKMSNGLSLLETSYSNAHLLITTLMCTGADDHPQCASSRATLYIVEPLIKLTINSEITFSNMIIDGAYRLPPYCADEMCLYCPWVETNDQGTLVNDKGTPVTAGKYARQEECNKFQNSTLFYVKSAGILALSNVDIVNFRYQPKAIIYNSGGIISLSSVNFTNIIPSINHGAVILQDLCSSPPYNCGSLTYTSGTVSYLNNGYEVTNSLAVGGFLYANGLQDITFISVTFVKNIAVNPNEGTNTGLIALKYFRRLVFHSCVFRTNIVTILIGVNAPLLSLVRRIDSSNNAIDFGIDHIYLKDTVIVKNLAQTSILSTSHGKDMQSIHMDSCKFSNNVAIKSSIVTLIYTGEATADMIDGWSTPVLENGSTVQGYFAPRHLYIQSSSFTENFGVSLFVMSSIANIEFSYTNFTNNGAYKAQTYNDFIVSDFISDSSAYLKLTVGSGHISSCQQILRFQACFGIALTSVLCSANMCDSGPAGIVATGTSKVFILKEVRFSENVAVATQGTVLTLSDTSLLIYFENVAVTGNTNAHSQGLGTVFFGEGLKVTFANSRFNNNLVSAGAGIYAQNVAQLSISSTTFENNQAIGGSAGAIYSIVNSGLTQYSMLVEACAFTNNKSATKGGSVLIASNNLTRPYKVVVTGSSFTNNSTPTTGAAFYIESLIILTADSSIQACTFTNNISQKGTIAVYFHTGTLTLNDCQFISNIATSGAGIFSSAQTGTQFIIISTSFTSNTSPGGVVALLDTDFDKTLHTTLCTFQRNQGVSVFIQRGNWTDIKSSFEQNYDSAVRLSDESIAMITSATFTENVALSRGGAFYISSAAMLKCSKCSFTRNLAKKHGGALFMEQLSKIQMNDSTFDSNTCFDKGSALFILDSAISTISSSAFTYNSATNSGVMYLLSSTLSLTEVTISDNTAQGFTPGIVLVLSSLTVSTSSFRNQRGSEGGFFYATTESTAEFRDCSFESGYAKVGGAFNVISSTLILTRSALYSMSALSGAGFMAYSQSIIALNQVTMDSLRADDSAIGFISTGTLTINNCAFSHYSSGGIQADKLTAAYVIASTFTYGTGAITGAFTCTKCQHILIQTCLFAHNSAHRGGGLYLTTQSDAVINSQYIVEFTSFFNNTAWRGGAVYSNNVNIMYKNCTFLSNNASLQGETTTEDWGRGGGVMADCSDVSDCIFNFTNCYFAYNHADVSGGGIAWQDVRPSVTNTTFVENEALYGNNISSFAIALHFISPSRKLESTTLMGVASGQLAIEPVTLALVDHYGNIVSTDNSSTAVLTPANVSTTAVSGVSKVTASNGYFTFDQYILTAEPGTIIEVRVSTSAIVSSKADKAKDAAIYIDTLRITAEMRNCTLGESHVGATCQVCEPGKYSLDPASTACLACPDTAICYGNFTMVPKAGYWRARIDTDLFYPCLFPQACIGSPDPPQNLSYTGRCATGYTGNLCQSCEIGYSRTNKHECELCPEARINIIRLVLLSLAIAVLVTIMVATTIKSAHKAQSLSSIYIKILMNYLQIVMLAASFNLAWPDQVQQFLSAQEMAGSLAQQTLSVDCMLDSSTVIFDKLVIMSIIPLILATFSVVVCMVIYVFRKCWNFPQDGFIASIVILLFLAHPILTKYLFSVFTCMDIDGQLFLLLQLDVKCWDSTHVTYIYTCAVPAIIIWVLGVPAICLGYLVKNKRTLQDMSIRVRLGFLFNGYRRQAYYWEFLILYRKIIIICCSVFLTTVSIPVQALIVMFVMVLALYLQDKVQPYTVRSLNSVELKSLACAAVTIYCGLFFLTRDLGSAAKFVLFIAIVVVNGLFVVHWAVKVFGFYVALSIKSVPCLKRHLGNLYIVKDGLDEDLFVRNRRVSPFTALSAHQDITPILPSQPIPLRSMQDLYKLRLKYEEAIWGQQAEDEETEGVIGLDPHPNSSISSANFSMDSAAIWRDDSCMQRSSSEWEDSLLLAPKG